MHATQLSTQDAVVPILPHRFSSGVVSISSDIARRWLGSNTHNRNLRGRDVEKYARDMKAGDWHLNGEAIKFDKNGVLMDGQHRLHAIVKADVTVLCLVVRGLESAAQDTMDTGTKRSAADMLQLQGCKNTSLLAATIRNAITVERVGYTGLSTYAVTHQEVSDYLAEHPDIEEAAAVAARVGRGIDCPPAIVGYALWALMAIDPQAANAFFTDAVSRVGLEAGDPALALGHRFAEARRNRERLTHAVYLSMIFRAWNARRAGRPMTVVRVKNSKGGLVDIPTPL